MKLHLGVLDVLVIIALVFAGIIAHNWYNYHPDKLQYDLLTAYVKKGKPPTAQGGGGMTAGDEWVR